MDFIPISSFDRESQPNWEGMQEGLDILQMTAGDFGGRERAFASVVSRLRSSDIELWEMTNFEKDDIAPDPENANLLRENRVTWVIEFPAFTWVPAPPA